MAVCNESATTAAASAATSAGDSGLLVEELSVRCAAALGSVAAELPSGGLAAVAARLPASKRRCLSARSLQWEACACEGWAPESKHTCVK